MFDTEVFGDLGNKAACLGTKTTKKTWLTWLFSPEMASPQKTDMETWNPVVVMVLHKHSSNLLCIKGLFGITLTSDYKESTAK